MLKGLPGFLLRCDDASSGSFMQVKQWVNGAALHVHIFLHWKRLTDPAAGESFSQDYLHGVDPLVKTYSEYLHRTVRRSGCTAAFLRTVPWLRQTRLNLKRCSPHSQKKKEQINERFLLKSLPGSDRSVTVFLLSPGFCWPRKHVQLRVQASSDPRFTTR